MQTNLFKSGNSLAVRIPRSLWPAEPGTAVEITKEGDHLIIQTVNKSLDGVLDVFAGFDAGFMSEGRENPDEQDRNW